MQVVAGVHNPWVTTDTSFKEFEQMRISMEPIMYQFGVDVMFNGHVHSYERSNPVYNYALNPCGMVHIVVGDAGNSEGPSGLNYYTGTLDHRTRPQCSPQCRKEGGGGAEGRQRSTQGLCDLTNSGHQRHNIMGTLACLLSAAALCVMHHQC